MTGAAVAIADTGALLAYYKEDEPDHAACRRAVETVGHLVVPPLVLAELDHLITSCLGARAAITVLGHLADQVAVGRYEVPEAGPHLRAARAVMQRHVELDIGLTDAMNAVLAMEFRTDTLFTIDRKHFRAIRPLTPHEAFRLLPDDLC